MIAQILEEKGEVIHHIRLRVVDIERTMERLEQSNTPRMDRKPVEVGDGSRVGLTDPWFAQNVL